MRLACLPAPAAASLYDAPNLLLQKFTGPAFTATTVLDFAGTARAGDEAGLIVFGYSYAWIGVRRSAGGARLVQVSNVEASKPGVEREVATIAAPSGKVFLRATVATDAKCRFAYSLDGQTFTPFGEEVQATVGRWVGAKVGLFAANAGSGPATEAAATAGHADFAWFHLNP
jgi:beta-xylosidase